MKAPAVQLCPHGGRTKDRFRADGPGGKFDACSVHLAQAVRAAGTTAKVTAL